MTPQFPTRTRSHLTSAGPPCMLRAHSSQQSACIVVVRELNASCSPAAGLELAYL